MLINDFKVLTWFSEIRCLSFTSNKVFYFSQVILFIACHLAIVSVWKTFAFLFKKKCSLEVAVLEFKKFMKILLSVVVKSLENKHEIELLHSLFFFLGTPYLRIH